MSEKCACLVPGLLTAVLLAPVGGCAATATVSTTCKDHSMNLKIRVFRVSGSPVCESYELAQDNGSP
jgi:hypothetical protein